MLDVVRRRGRRCSSARAGPGWRRSARDPARVARATRSTASGASAATAQPFELSSCARWSPAPSTWAPAWPSTRATRASRASARCCAAPRSTSCRTSSTCCAARCRSSARARRSRCRSTQYTERQRGRLAVKPGHHRLGAGQRPRVAAVGASASSSTSGTSSTARCGSTCEILARTARMLVRGDGLYKGETGGWQDRYDAARPAHRRRQALRHRRGVRPARDGRRRRPEPARAGAVRGARAHAPFRASTTPATCPRCRRCATSTTSARSCR